MRNFEERKAEVFRRSEKRIKERKQRKNHILMTCIPLVLCLTIFGAFLFPQMDDLRQAPESSHDQFSGAMGTEAVGGLFTGSVEVSGNGVSSYYTSVENVQGIISLINGIVAIPETEVDGSDDRDYITDENESTNIKGDPKEEGYKILIKRSDGSTSEYVLVDSQLIDQATQMVFPMREETCNDLKRALGIPLN